MNQLLTIVCAFVFPPLLCTGPIFAQAPKATTGNQAESTAGKVTAELTVAEVETALAALEADTGVGDALKDQIRPKYQQAIDALKAAAENNAKATEFAGAIQAAPEQMGRLREQLQSLPSVEDSADISPAKETEQLQKDVDSRRAVLNGLRDELTDITSQLANLQQRPVEIDARIPEAQRELSETQRQLALAESEGEAPSLRATADRMLLRAGQLKLQNELQMLRQEQLSHVVRNDWFQANADLLKRQVENVDATLNTLVADFNKRLARESKKISSQVDMLPDAVFDGDEAARALVTEVQTLARELETVTGHLSDVPPAEDFVRTGLEDLTVEYESVRRQVTSDVGGGALSPIFLGLRRQAAVARSNVLSIELPTFADANLARLKVDQKLRLQPKVEEDFADSADAVRRVVATRNTVLNKLGDRYRDLIRALAPLESYERQYLNKADEVDEFVKEQLFWVRSSPAISGKTFTDIPAALRWATLHVDWSELGDAMQQLPPSTTVALLVTLIVAALLLVMRGRIGAALDRTGERTRRISTDRYSHTVEALFWTILLAIPLPLMLAATAWFLEQMTSPSDWVQNTSSSLQLAAWVLFGCEFFVAVFQPGRLGTAHFRWDEEKLARLARTIRRFAVAYVPAVLLMLSSHDHDMGVVYFDSVGRIILILTHVWTAIIAWDLFYSSNGLLTIFEREQPTPVVRRWRRWWCPLIVACPIVLVVLAGIGYLITAAESSLGLLMTLFLVAGGCVLYGLALRWFMIRQRRLALAELARRRARQETVASEEPQETIGEVVSVDSEDDEPLDVESIGQQTRALLRLLFTLTIAVVVIVYWAQTVPLISRLSAISIPLTGGMNLLAAIQAFLIVIFTWVAAKNIPGLLELAVLRARTIEVGTRHAIITLSQYAVVAIGLILLFNVLKLDWSKFGWIAAAFSVGLGFGLQEVVANFVCGLILLFEQPIRVGDVVTVEGTTGTVTKIRMRATTITNWDRQEFVVPNKTFITAPLLNWTLSTALNRILVQVGVAYGTDTDQARQIMLDEAADHPNVLDEPAPMATFEQFADSSLNLLLRAYLPDVDGRLATITELHTEIHKRFAEAGIEIAFPQRDLHIRSGWENAQRNPEETDRSDRSEDAR